MFTQIGAILDTALIIIFFVILLSGKTNYSKIILVITAWVQVLIIFDLAQYLPNLLTIIDLINDVKVGK